MCLATSMLHFVVREHLCFHVLPFIVGSDHQSMDFLSLFFLVDEPWSGRSCSTIPILELWYCHMKRKIEPFLLKKIRIMN